MDNLISTAFMVFPIAAEIPGDRKFFIKREVETTFNSERIEHTKGLAVEFTPLLP